MRVLAIAAVFFVIATGSVAVAASPSAWSPTLKDCVTGWNASPALSTRTTQAAEIVVVASFSLKDSGTTSPKAKPSQPGCMVAVTQGNKRGLMILGKWRTRKSIEWRSPSPMSGFSKISNALIHPGGRLSLR